MVTSLPLPGGAGCSVIETSQLWPTTEISASEHTGGHGQWFQLRTWSWTWSERLLAATNEIACWWKDKERPKDLSTTKSTDSLLSANQIVIERLEGPMKKKGWGEQCQGRFAVRGSVVGWGAPCFKCPDKAFSQRSVVHVKLNSISAQLKAADSIDDDVPLCSSSSSKCQPD